VPVILRFFQRLESALAPVVGVAGAAETQLAILGEAALLVVATTKQWKLTTMMGPVTTVMMSTTELNTFATVLFNGAQRTSTTGISVTPSLPCDSCSLWYLRTSS